MKNYLTKHSYYPQKIFDLPEKDLGIVVVIPAFCEGELLKSLQALKSCTKPDCAAEVIVVANRPVDADEQTRMETEEMVAFTHHWIMANSEHKLKYFLLNACDLPAKIAGVGLARKIGMDEAVRRLEIAGNPRGIICCFDADSTCDPNYFTELENHFKSNSKATACSICFEHPLSGEAFPAPVYKGIIHYELHLRYYIQGLQYAGHPFAFHTIGSSMAVRADIYQKQGGMNKRKAGEDFYFLHKIIPLGNFTELNTTRIIPSPRPSRRVPFGTGRAVNNWLENKNQLFFSYHPHIFKELQSFLNEVEQLYDKPEIVLKKLSKPVISFLAAHHFTDKLREIKQNSTDLNSFKKRFFVWFDGFQTLKFVHYLRDHFFSNIEIKEAGLELLCMQNQEQRSINGVEEMLEKYREVQKKIM